MSLYLNLCTHGLGYMEDKFLAVELLSQSYFEEHCLWPPERQPQEISSPAGLEQSPSGLGEVCFHPGEGGKDGKN